MLFFLLSCVALRTRVDESSLVESASTYWMYVRWGAPERAVVFLTDVDQKAALASWYAAPTWRMSDARVVAVSVGDRLPKEERPRQREGVVVVQIERIDELSGKVSSFQVKQDWWLEGGRWVVSDEDWAPGALWVE